MDPFSSSTTNGLGAEEAGAGTATGCAQQQARVTLPADLRAGAGVFRGSTGSGAGSMPPINSEDTIAPGDFTNLGIGRVPQHELNMRLYCRQDSEFPPARASRAASRPGPAPVSLLHQAGSSCPAVRTSIFCSRVRTRGPSSGSHPAVFQ